MSARIVAVDVDDVSLWLMPEWLARFARLSGLSLRETDVVGWDTVHRLPTHWQAAFYGILHDHDLYERVAAVRGASEGLSMLRASGAQIVFPTAGALGSLDSKWSRMRELGLLAPHDLRVVAEQKVRCVRADVFVDDRADTILDALAAGRQGVLFSRPWNDWARRAVLAGGGTVADTWEAVVDAVVPATPTLPRVRPIAPAAASPDAPVMRDVAVPLPICL